MQISRRTFVKDAATVAATAVCTAGVSPHKLLALATDPTLAPHITGKRICPTPATHFRPYRSKPVTDPRQQTWVQVDLGQTLPIEAVFLYPASARMYPGKDQYYGGEAFPLRFRIEASAEPEFGRPATVADYSTADFPDPQDNITRYAAGGVKARYVRLTATRLRPVVEEFSEAEPSAGPQPKYSTSYNLMLAKLAVLSGGRDVSVGCHASADSNYGNPDDLAQLTRAERQDGEDVHRDNPERVTDPSTWTPVQYRARTPTGGVTLGDGVFRNAMENNIRYLLDSYSTDDLLRQFYERTGKIKDYKATGNAVFWEEDLAGSNAGRFLMGAGNTVRWIDDPELKQRMDAVITGIAECREPNGYIMAYAADTIFYSERAAYTRAWLTHGLLEAGYAGDRRGFELLRGYYDWFNHCPYLPLLLRGVIQGGQGMIANTRVALSPVGKPADTQVIQRCFLEPAWMKGLAQEDKDQVWQYPYDRPHCYLLTNLEAYLDLYRATGDRRYYDGVLGAWNLYHQNWQQPGGSISIIEFQTDPPRSNYLHQKLGELCGSSFWVFLSQRFQMMHPDEERYATEIEKSIYNVALANQDGSSGLRYHTLLEGTKEKSTHHNTCCEGQGTRLIGSLPEHIYSTADDGLYVHLYEPSTIRWKLDGSEASVAMHTRFPLENKVECVVNPDVKKKFNLRLRVPSWAQAEMEIRINGESAGSGKPGSYFSLDREWQPGDRVTFSLPAGLRATRYDGFDKIPGRTRYAIEYGPVLLAAVGSSRVDLPDGFDPKEVSDFLIPATEDPLHFTIRGVPNSKVIPYWLVGTEEFTCFPSVADSSRA